MALSKAEIAAQVMEHVCAHAAHGYSQPARKGDGTTETVTLSDGSTVTVHGGDYDCSELVRTCYAAAGVLPADSYMWTGNEYALLTRHGFRSVAAKSVSQLRRGDVLLKKGHTALYLGDGKLGEAAGDELGGITGPKAGDQTGREVRVRSYYGPWDYILRHPDETTASAASPGFSAAGRWTVAVNWLNVRDLPSLSGEVVTHYTLGQTVVLDGWHTVADGYVWGRYTGASSGRKRYVAIGPDTGKADPSDYLKRA